MAPTPLARVAGLAVLLATLGFGAAWSARPGTHIGGMWPVGLASGLLVIAAPRLRPAVAGVVALIAFGTYAASGHPLGVAVGYAVSVVALAAVTTVVLAHRGPGGADDLDLVGYLSASAAGALTGAAGFALTSAVTGFGSPAYVGLVALAAHLASQLTLVPFFARHRSAPGPADTRERVLRWGLAIAVSALVFVPSLGSTVVFLVLPLLAWTAMRASLREARWLLIVVSTIANLAAFLDAGPFVLTGDRPASELVPLASYAFIMGAALVTIPFAMTAQRRRASEQEAVRANGRYQRLLSASTGVSIVECDEVGRITLVNPGCEALLGYSADELVGRFPDLFHTQEEIERQAAAFGTEPDLLHVSLAMAEPDVGARDWKFQHKDGRELTVSMRLERILDDESRVTGYLSTAEDVTEVVRTREALVAALDTERRAVARLTEVDRTKDAFVSSVSHELRTPITNIVGYLELLLDGAYGDTTAPQHEALRRIDLNSHRLLELIDDLLTLSSVESLDVEIAREPVDLRAVAERGAEQVRPSAIARRQRLDVHLPDRPVVVHGDAPHLERMLANLAGNAVKFTPEGGSVAVRVLDEGGHYAVEVHDTGIGIPLEEQPQLFNRFFRTQAAQRAAIQGSGLGLSIARSIAELHGARITATSRPGEGSVFRVAFPVNGHARQR